MLVKVNSQFGRSLDGMMKELFNEFPSTVSKAVREDVLHFPPVNIIEGPENYQVNLAAPGLEKSDFKVSLENHLLTISAEKKEDAIGDQEKIMRREFSNRSFKRSFTIDEKIDSENITAKYENGILKLVLPKKEQLKAGAKEINIL